MTMTVRQRKKIIRDLAMLFAEKGKVLTIPEYKELPAEERPHRLSRVRNAGGSWSRMLQRMKAQEPDLWDMANGGELQHEFMAEKAREEAKGGPFLSENTDSTVDAPEETPAEEPNDIAEAMKQASGEVNEEESTDK